MLRIGIRRRVGGEDSSERVDDLGGVIREVDLPRERADGDDGRLANLLADVGSVKELEDGGEDEMVVLLNAQPKGGESMEDLD
jgi:hypothetical protein